MPPGSRIEVSFESFSAARRLGELVSGREARRLKEDGKEDERFEKQRREGETLGGAALVVDYGDEVASGDSWRVSWCALLWSASPGSISGPPIAQ